jgi:hypothetical protein
MNQDYHDDLEAELRTNCLIDIEEQKKEIENYWYSQLPRTDDDEEIPEELEAWELYEALPPQSDWWHQDI